ncbi:hypothetical protein EI94DRAFT_1895767 [Lactarius quietus]|nr:hypothetical protein EI94DRAFT_1895767 [Lactarius quietus]
MSHTVHDSAEVSSLNRTSPLEALCMVVPQQVYKTIRVYVWLSEVLKRSDDARRRLRLVLLTWRAHLGRKDVSLPQPLQRHVTVASLSHLLVLLPAAPLVIPWPS